MSGRIRNCQGCGGPCSHLAKRCHTCCQAAIRPEASAKEKCRRRTADRKLASHPWLQEKITRLAALAEQGLPLFDGPRPRE